MVHDLYNLRRHERIADAAFAAYKSAEKHGDPYTVIECGGVLGFAAIRAADVPMYGLAPTQIHSTWPSEMTPEVRKQRLNELLHAATSEVAS